MDTNDTTGPEPTKAEEKQSADISTIIFQSVLLRIVDDLTDEQKTKLNELMAVEGGEAEVAEYLKNIVPNIEEIIQEEVKSFEEEAAQIMGEQM